MKRPEYTALVTNVYKRALLEKREPTGEELEQLRAVFSRDGFTDGYFTGKRGGGMFGTRSEDSGREARALYKQAQAIYQSQPEPPSVPARSGPVRSPPGTAIGMRPPACPRSRPSAAPPPRRRWPLP